MVQEPLRIYEGRAPSKAWVDELRRILEVASWEEPSHLQEVLPLETAMGLIHDATMVLEKTPTVIDIAPPTTSEGSPQEGGADIVIVGDTHGQLHDVLRLLELAGEPSETSLFVFNGDFVPGHVTLLRGNHETRFCTMVYGFRTELDAKYGVAGVRMYSKLLKLFAALPLAAVVAGRALILHGGLFRAPPKPKKKDFAPKGKKAKGKKVKAVVEAAASGEGGLGLAVGSLQDLREAKKGGLDPNGQGSSVLATDVLWSDPDQSPGMRDNDERGVGLVFGADTLQQFLAASGLELVVRSHEGPDARERRDGMPKMGSGFSEDLVCSAGRLVTVFSAPDYPQFTAVGESRTGNEGAFVRLSAETSYAVPRPSSFPAVQRPKAGAYYDVEGLGATDDELDVDALEGDDGSS